MTNRRCARCHGPLKCVRGTIVLALRCRDCGRGGEIVRDATGRPYNRRGPAVDPTFNAGGQAKRLVTDGGRPQVCPGCGQPYGLDDEPFCVCGRRRPGIEEPRLATDGGQPYGESVSDPTEGQAMAASETVSIPSGEADDWELGIGAYRVLEAYAAAVAPGVVNDVKTMMSGALTHFPELTGETVNVGIIPDDDFAYARAFVKNRIVCMPDRDDGRRPDWDLIYHELAHLAIEVRHERGEDVPTSSEEYCSIVAVSRMPGHRIERDSISYIGEPSVPPAEWPGICERALEYREEHGAGSHYIKRCREWLGVLDGDAA